MPRWTVLVAVVALVAAACSSSSDDASGASQPDASASASTPLECEVKNYPCSLSDVPIEILERSDTLSDDVVAMFESGASTSDVDTFFNEQTGMAEFESDDEAVRFRLDGGRGTWILRTSAFATRSAPGAGAGSQKTVNAVAGPLFNVAGPESKDKRAVVLSPMLWDFAETDDGPAVAEILAGTRGYEGRVEFLANESTTVTNVTVDSFKGWENLQVVHVVTHGTRLCKRGPCRAVIAAQLVRGQGPTGEGILTKAQNQAEFTDRGLEIGKAEGSRGLELEVPLAIVLLTADFFRDQYPGGLDDTLVFFNACKTFGAEATDLADAISGTTSVFLGWSESVDSDAAFAASVALYEDLSEGGYPIEVAHSRLGGLISDASSGAQLLFGKRKDGDGLRIRDVVELLDPGSGELLSSSSTISIVGTQGDGEPDSVPYAVRVDGMTTEFAPLVTLHVSVNGLEIGPQAITNGESNEKDQWVVRGEIPLGFDVEEDTTVNFKAWVDLYSGGESDDETPALVTGSEPIMGFEWTMEATKTVSFPDSGEQQTTGVLTLEFQEGQDVKEPKPRYVVAGGTVTYDGSTRSGLGCTYTGGGMTFDVTPAMIPLTRDGFDRNILIFDTTASPIEYSGIIQIEGPDYIRTQTCPDDDPNDEDIFSVNYGGASGFMGVVEADHLTVTSETLIQAGISTGSSVVDDYTITRTK